MIAIAKINRELVNGCMECAAEQLTEMRHLPLYAVQVPTIGMRVLLCEQHVAKLGEIAVAATPSWQRPCGGSCDIALASRQVGPDGIVPGNARECAELWEREAARLSVDLAGTEGARKANAELAERMRDERDALREQLEQATKERDELGVQLQSVQADMGTIAGELGADDDDVDTLVKALRSRLADRSEALAALRSIARVMSYEPEDHEDLVEAVRLLKEERDEALGIAGARNENYIVVQLGSRWAVWPRSLGATPVADRAEALCEDRRHAEYIARDKNRRHP